MSAIVAAVADPDRRVIALWDGMPDEELSELLEVAGRLGARIAVECWHDDGPRLAADEYDRRLAALLDDPSPGVIELGVAASSIAPFVDVAGPITAWPSIDMIRG